MDVQACTVPETFVSGLSHIEVDGANGRFCLYINRIGSCGTVVQVPKRHIIMPLCNLDDAILKSSAVSAARHTERFYSLFPTLQH